MESKELSLTHLVQYPTAHHKESNSKYPTILALHGRGSNERDLIGLAQYLPKDLLWISPRGTFVLGPDSYEWFQIKEIGKPDPTRLANALDTIDHFIDEIIESYPVDESNLYLLGFSQGSIVSLSYALTEPQRVAGVIVQSGYMPQEAGLKIDKAGLTNKPFILTHGMQDPLLPIDWARGSRDTLLELGVQLEYHEFNMGHQINAESMGTISAWLEKQLQR
jgi:phospholipase/carboxylesterase